MMPSANLPLPEVTELPDVPPEFARGADGPVPAPPWPMPRQRRRAPRSATAAQPDRVEVWHLEDPRASIFALFR